MYAFREAINSTSRNPVMSLVSILTITVTLTVFSSFAVFSLFMNSVVEKVRGNEEINVYLLDVMSDEDMLALDAVIASMKEVESTNIMSKEDARKEFEKMYGDDLISTIGENPLPRTIVVKMAKDFRMAADLETVAQRISTINGVEAIEYGHEWMSRLDVLFIAFFIVVTVLLSLATAACMLIIANTISMTVLSRKETIEIMQLVGATDSFIRRPFYVEGLMQGLLSGIISFLFMYGVYTWTIKTFPNIETYIAVLTRPGTSLPYGGLELALIIPIGAFMGLLGSFIAVRRAF